MAAGMDSHLSVEERAKALFEREGAALYRFAVMLLRRGEDAEDVVQEAFLKLLTHLRAGGGDDNLRGWLFTVASHAARDRQRRRIRWLPWSAADEPAVQPALLPDEDGRLKAARDALLQLTRRDRLLLALRASGLSYRDLAAAAAIRPASVGRLLARAIDRHRRAMARAGAGVALRAHPAHAHGGAAPARKELL
jgi:RNA polymerase sigma-70 factor (ECF subfamily)